MSESETDFDSERERTLRFVKFMGFMLVVVVLWYTFDIAGGV